MIEVKALEKSFAKGKVKAVDGAAFTAADGAITTLLGANGAGKTTTLSTALGLLKPDAGTIRVDGIDVAADPKAVRRRIGWFPDAFGLYPRLTAREQVRYFGQLHGMGGAELEAAIDRTLAELEMEKLADRRSEGFSTGERMKVALARSMVHSPQNLILDEPTRGLDIMSVRMLRATLRRLRDEGRAILMSSHVMAEVEELSDHVVVISAGRVVGSGTTEELVRSTGAPSLEEAFVALAVQS
jgi:sodium transport system ATP-binding protein